MLNALHTLFERVILRGDVTIFDTKGQAYHFGRDDHDSLVICAHISGRMTEYKLAFDPSFSFGEAYMTGRLTFSKGTLYDFLSLLLEGVNAGRVPWFSCGFDLLRYFFRSITQYNPIHRSYRNVKYHYDIDQSIYDLFLDQQQLYSCAYFTPGDDLEQAQYSKMRHIAAKLRLKSGQRVLDIGSGWGSFALYLTRICPVDVLGITLSQSQLHSSECKAKKLGLEKRLTFAKQDYRTLDEKFDRVVSIGMFEHVGLKYYKTYFKKIYDLLNDDGAALIHTIGRTDGPGFTNPFIAKYIFPGGYFPALSEILPAIEKSGLIVSDIEVLRLHYADTLKAWRERFMEQRDKAQSIKGDRFCRMWEFYLAGSEAAFRYQGLVVFQIQLSKKIGTLPITRDYISHTERQLRIRDENRVEPELTEKNGF